MNKDQKKKNSSPINLWQRTTDKAAVLNSSTLSFDKQLQPVLYVKYQLNFYQDSQSVMPLSFIRSYFVEAMLLIVQPFIKLSSMAHFILSRAFTLVHVSRIQIMDLII